MHVNDILLRADLQAVSERLYRQVDWSGGPLSCWPWQGKTLKGYGEMQVGDHVMVRAHRLSYALANGPLPLTIGGERTCVLHHCDNPPCCNPAHLFLGTNHDNIDDMMDKSRQAKGEDSGRSKMTEAQVLAVLRSRESAAVLASQYEVGLATIWNIRQRKTWRHIGADIVPTTVFPGGTKLTEEEVRAIRTDPRSSVLVSRAYKVSPKAVRDIRDGKTWKKLI